DLAPFPTRRSSDLREGVCPRAGKRVVGERTQAPDLLLGEKDGRGVRELRPLRAARSRGAAAQAGAGGPARILEAAGAHRGADQVLPVGERTALGGGREVLLRGGPARLRGVWAAR